MSAEQIRVELQDQFRSAIDELRGQIAQLQVRQTALESPDPHRRPRPSLPDPDRFNGQAVKFDTWRASVLAKLTVDGPAIGGSVAQFNYVFMMLEPKVQAMVLPHLTAAQSSDHWDYRAIVEQLTRVYDNPRKVQEAEERFMAIRQGDDSLYQYLAKFERVRYEARANEWPDRLVISILRKGLSAQLRDRLSQQLDHPTSYVDFVQLVQKLAHGPHGTDQHQQHQQHPPGTTPMELGNVEISDLSAVEKDLAQYERKGTD